MTELVQFNKHTVLKDCDKGGGQNQRTVQSGKQIRKGTGKNPKSREKQARYKIHKERGWHERHTRYYNQLSNKEVIVQT